MFNNISTNVDSHIDLASSKQGRIFRLLHGILFEECLLVMGHLEGRRVDGGQSIAKPIRKQEAKVKRVILDGKAENL